MVKNQKSTKVFWRSFIEKLLLLIKLAYDKKDCEDAVDY